MSQDSDRNDDLQDVQSDPVVDGDSDVPTVSILDGVDEEVEELEDEQIVWTEDMMPKFETPPQLDQHTNNKKGAGVSTVGSETVSDRPVEDIKTVKFSQFAPSPKGAALGNLDLLLDVKMPLVVELGRSKMLIRDILELGPGSVIELDKAAGEPVDLLVNGKLLARGEVVVIDESFGLRITEIVGSAPEVSE
jgi:flagellar motor switch protein FliN